MKSLNVLRTIIPLSLLGVGFIVAGVAAMMPQEHSESKNQDQELIKGPTTADELLAALESSRNDFSWHPDSTLPEAEIDKAAAALREQYPFLSVRDRLQNPQETDVSEKQLRIWGGRLEALTSLHSNEVNDFVNRSGQGFGRMIEPASPYDLPLPTEFVERIESVPVDSSLLGEPVVTLQRIRNEDGRFDDHNEIYFFKADGMPSVELTQRFHEQTMYGFASRDSTGLIRSVDEVAGFETHRIRHRSDWNGSLRMMNEEQIAEYYPDMPGKEITWRANQLQLVSLLLHDEPAVYVSENLPEMEELSGTDVETRALNDFERVALERLQSGENVVSTATPNRIVMLGALRATENCLQCHGVEVGELLGAFSYEFLRDPRVSLDKVEF